MFDLDDDALALIRAARGGDEPTAEERARALAAFRAALEQSAQHDQVHDPVHEQARALERGARGAVGISRLRGEGRFTLTWSLAALITLASAGAFADWQAVAQQVRAWSEWSAQLFRAEPQRLRSQRVHASGGRPAVAAATPPALGSTSDFAPGSPPQGLPLVTPQHLPALNPQPDVPSALSAPAQPLAQPSVAPAPERSAPHPSPARVNELDLELELIAQARDALAAARYAETLSLVRSHAQRFATGALLEERRAIEALTHCRAGQGTSWGAEFVARWPDSMFTPRIKVDCALHNSVPLPRALDTD